MALLPVPGKAKALYSPIRETISAREIDVPWPLSKAVFYQGKTFSECNRIQPVFGPDIAEGVLVSQGFLAKNESPRPSRDRHHDHSH